jgi:hypothetical protein
MDDLVKKKVKYIMLRYKVDSKNLNTNLKLELLKRWIKSCADSEEYEMALVLKKKRNELVRELRLEKKGDRHFSDSYFIKLKWLFRKFKRKIFQL